MVLVANQHLFEFVRRAAESFSLHQRHADGHNVDVLWNWIVLARGTSAGRGTYGAASKIRSDLAGVGLSKVWTMLHPSTSSVAPSNGPISVGISGSLQLELISSHPHDQIHVLKQPLLDPLPEPTLGLEPEPLGRLWLSEIDRLWDVESEELPDPLPDDPLPLPLELDPVPADLDSLPERLRLSEDDVEGEPLETERLESD